MFNILAKRGNLSIVLDQAEEQILCIVDSVIVDKRDFSTDVDFLRKPTDYQMALDNIIQELSVTSFSDISTINEISNTSIFYNPCLLENLTLLKENMKDHIGYIRVMGKESISVKWVNSKDYFSYDLSILVKMFEFIGKHLIKQITSTYNENNVHFLQTVDGEYFSHGRIFLKEIYTILDFMSLLNDSEILPYTDLLITAFSISRDNPVNKREYLMSLQNQKIKDELQTSIFTSSQLPARLRRLVPTIDLVVKNSEKKEIIEESRRQVEQGITPQQAKYLTLVLARNYLSDMLRLSMIKNYEKFGMVYQKFYEEIKVSFPNLSDEFQNMSDYQWEYWMIDYESHLLSQYRYLIEYNDKIVPNRNPAINRFVENFFYTTTQFTLEEIEELTMEKIRLKFQEVYDTMGQLASRIEDNMGMLEQEDRIDATQIMYLDCMNNFSVAKEVADNLSAAHLMTICLYEESRNLLSEYSKENQEIPIDMFFEISNLKQVDNYLELIST